MLNDDHVKRMLIKRRTTKINYLFSIYILNCLFITINKLYNLDTIFSYQLHLLQVIKRERERTFFSLVSLPTLPSNPSSSISAVRLQGGRRHSFHRWSPAPPVSSCSSHTHRSYLTASLPSCSCVSRSLFFQT